MLRVHESQVVAWQGQDNLQLYQHTKPEKGTVQYSCTNTQPTSKLSEQQGQPFTCPVIQPLRSAAGMVRYSETPCKARCSMIPDRQWNNRHPHV